MTAPAPITSGLLGALPGIRHGFFTRQGGVSTGLYRSLNVGVGSGDDPLAVTENRARVAAYFGVDEAALLTCYQVHSAIAHTAEAAWSRPEGDAVIADRAGLVCGALSADCAPVLMADPHAGVVAAAHAGWRGAISGVVEAAAARMWEMGARPERIVAVVGPCIGPASYEVDLAFEARFLAESDAARFFRPGRTADKRLFDLPGYVLERLARAGVERCEWTGHDTYADEARFFSNRRAFHRGEPDYGRLVSAISLDQVL